MASEPKIQPQPEYDLDDFKSGDILLFNGRGYWFSYVIEWATWSDYSHIGIVLRKPTYLHPKLKGVYMLESGTEKFPDAIEHRICYGVQVVNLKTVIEKYTGHVYYRKLTSLAPFKGPNYPSYQVNQALQEIWPKIRDHGYDDRLWDLFKTEINLDWGDNHRTDKFICSALVTYLYQKAQLLNTELEWDLIKPYEFAPNGQIETKYLTSDIKLGALICLK
jgi:hypothetical protein